MRTAALVSMVVLAGCRGGDSAHPQSTNEPISCSDGEIPIYGNRFAQASGASGVATGADAIAGMTNSAPSTQVVDQSPTTSDGQPLTAMTVECGKADCGAGEVGVEAPSMDPTSGPTTGAPTSTGVSTTVDTTSPSAGAAPAQPAPSQPPIACAPPPPSCPTGQSPQWTLKGTWECTDCALVVTYGGTFGNYRRCVGTPHLTCPSGEVPTWMFEDEAWECEPTCDNGQYDQHTIGMELVCVPC